LLLNFKTGIEATMKSVIIVRHAKSSWDDQSLADIDRPLNERGERDAPRMANRLKERNVHPQQMISSPALRAISTCRDFAKVLGFPEEQIQKVTSVYHAGSDTLLDVLRHARELDSDGPLMLFGHNPGLTDFVNELLDEEIDNIPTTGVVAAKLNITRWKDATAGCGTLEYFDYPKLR
jgi:phosphohistidine phosphatase